MPRPINRKELLILLSGGGVALFLSIPVFYPVPAWAKIVTLLFVAYTVYLTLRLAWIAAEPEDSSISLKPRAARAQSRGLCSVCGNNRQGHNTLKFGYREALPRSLNLELVDALLMGEGMDGDIQISLPVCDKCAGRFIFLSKFSFFAPLGLDMSSRVLRRKPGYLRGLKYPFEPSNMKIAE